MIDRQQVTKTLSLGKQELLSNKKGILSLAMRTQIWKSMRDIDDDALTCRHRNELKLLCIRHVQHLWDRAFPEDSRLEQMLTLIQDLIDHRADPRGAEQLADSFFEDVLDKEQEFSPITQPAVFVAQASSSAVSSACNDNPEYDTADRTADDDELLPESLEASYCCASAAANALNWQPAEETDVEARREFWTWYLDEAIPQVLAE